MADPIFDKSDTPGSSKLPPELVGKSPDEIAAYYQRREEIYQERLRSARTTPPPSPKKDEPDDKIDLFNDPTGSINRVVERKVGTAVDRVTQVAAPAIMNACKVSLRENHPDAAKFMAEIEEAMNRMDEASRMNPSYWEVAYTNVKGRHTDRLINEALENDRKARNPVEKPTAKGSDPPKPRDLSDMEKTVAAKFDMTDSEYRDAANRFESTDGLLPITTDNRRRRSQPAKVSA